MSAPLAKIPDGVDTLLLDLDGTLLDLAYDTNFWLEILPAHYGAARGLTADEARAEILPRMREWEGTLPWYCVDHWSRALDFDIVALKKRFPERIAWLPGAREFLARQRALGRRLVLATNSHPSTLQLKDRHTGLSEHLDVVHSSHEFGAPKEDPVFWQGFRRSVQFDPERTAFLDDNLAVLQAGRDAGIAHPIAITDPDSSRPRRDPPTDFNWVVAVAQLDP
ncbi:HAD family hydrolase [bacterium]|nr:MAG: HAD family hydrolase [bacterium]